MNGVKSSEKYLAYFVDEIQMAGLLKGLRVPQNKVSNSGSILTIELFQ